MTDENEQEKSNITEKYSPIKIKVIKMYGGGFDHDIYLKLSNKKFVKICNQNECSKSTLDKYEKKGIENVYLLTESYNGFVSSVRKIFSDTIEASKKEGVSETARQLSNTHSVVQAIFQEGNISNESKELAKCVTQETVNIIENFDIMEKFDLVGTFENFKQNCSGQYLHVLLTSYLSSCIIDNFSWKNKEIKEKITLAAMLCDILLTKKDFDEFNLKKNDIGSLPNKILQHPLKIADMIANDTKFISAETITIIRQHHERPNGKGFPKGLEYAAISMLTSIFIVANYFVEQMFGEEYVKEFEQERISRIVEQIKEKFYSGNFRKASDSLAKLFENKTDLGL